MTKILIVEDDTSIAHMYQLKFELQRFEVKTAENGVAGLELCEEFRPDLVLLDLMMPVMNGDEMLARMRATEWGAKPRVIILTNISKNEAPMRLRFFNVDRYIVKAHHTPAQVVEIANEILHIR